MDGPATPQIASPLSGADIVAAFGWWRDAGVDLDFSEEPQRWLAAAEPADAPPALPAAFAAAAAAAPREVAAPVATTIGGDAALPGDLSAFREWWLAEPSLDEGQVRGRVPPRGEAGAPWMVIVAQPEVADTDILLSGPEGSLLSAMLSAMGIAPEQVYVASALARHTPLPDWDALGRRGLGRVLAHHVSLVAPQRLIVFGSGILPLFGHDPAQSAQTSTAFNHDQGRVPMLSAFELSAIAARPARKAAFWQKWLEFTGS